jgi:hypothetical protein
MITSLAQLKALELEYKEMYLRGTALEEEYAEVKAHRLLVEDALGIGEKHIEST